MEFVWRIQTYKTSDNAVLLFLHIQKNRIRFHFAWP